MKHILNDLTEQEKNSIREQHTGGMKVMTEGFSKLINSKLGDVKLVVKEQIPGTSTSDVVIDCFKTHFESPNMELPKSCKELAKEIKDSKKLPLDITKYGPCTSDLSKSTGSDIFTTMGKLKDVGECIIKKANSPVVNEQDLMGMMNQVLTGFGGSDKKVKEFCDMCNAKVGSYKDRGLVNRYADVIRDAVQGIGTNEESIYHVFESLVSFNEFCGLVKAYKNSYNVDLYTDLSSDISEEAEWARIMRPIRNLVKNFQPSDDQVGPPLSPTEKAELERQAQVQQDRMGKGKIPQPTLSGITFDKKTNTYGRPDGR